MIKISECKELNYYDHYELLTYFENKELNKIYDKIKEYKTIEFQSKSRKNDFCIIHKSSKKDNTIQISYFDNKGAYADKEVNSYKDALELIYKSYKVKEVA